MISRNELTKHLNKLLNIYNYSDYGPNGLQIEGKENISKIAFAVSATQDSIRQAIEAKADALIVHHGLFWKFHGPKTITGAFARRVKPLCQNEINLFGYHLPLDAHIELGNAASLAHKLNLLSLAPFGDHKGMPTGVWGILNKPISVSQFAKQIEQVCNHKVLISTPDINQEIKSLGIITGGANGDWIYSKRLTLDAYLTGEMSEHDWHEAKESNITMFAAGHHATERFGVQSLMEHLKNKYNLECVFIDSANPA